MKKLIPLLMSLIFLAAPAHAGPIQITLSGRQDSIDLIQALATSGMKMKIDHGVRSIEINDLQFRRTNGHACDNEEWWFCGFGDQIEFSRGPKEIKEPIQLAHTLQKRFSKQRLEATNGGMGDCAAGSCFETWANIRCTWKLEEYGKDETRSLNHDPMKVVSPVCTAEIHP